MVALITSQRGQKSVHATTQKKKKKRLGDLDHDISTPLLRDWDRGGWANFQHAPHHTSKSCVQLPNLSFLFLFFFCHPLITANAAAPALLSLGGGFGGALWARATSPLAHVAAETFPLDYTLLVLVAVLVQSTIGNLTAPAGPLIIRKRTLCQGQPTNQAIRD